MYPYDAAGLGVGTQNRPPMLFKIKMYYSYTTLFDLAYLHQNYKVMTHLLYVSHVKCRRSQEEVNHATGLRLNVMQNADSKVLRTPRFETPIGIARHGL